MKRAKRIYLLLGVLVLVCAAAFGVMQYEEEKEQIANSDEIVLEVESDTVESLSWEYDTESLAFHKDEIWYYDNDETFPVDEEKIDALLAHFQALGASFIIEEVTDYAQYGLDNPVCTIHLTTADTSYEILLGDYSTMDSQRYVSIGDGNVYLVSDDPLEDFSVTLRDLIDNDDIPNFDQVSQISIAGASAYEVVYDEDSDASYCSDDVYFVEQADGLLPLDTSRVESYLDTIRYLDLTNYVTYCASETDLETYGLDDPELTVTIAYTDVLTDEETEETTEESGTFTISVSRTPEDRAAAAEADAEAETDEEASDEEDEEEITAYVRIGESQILYEITGSSYEALMAASYDDLRHEEVLSADFSDITGFEITLEGADYTITSEGTEEEKTFYYGDEALETEDLEEALEALCASSFTDESPTREEEIRLTVYLDNENFPEVEIRLYRYDGTQCLAVVDGEPVSLVPRTEVVALIEAVHAIVL